MVTLSLLAAGLIASLVFYLMYRSDRNRNIPLPWLSAGLRALLSFLLVLLILAPRWNRRVVEEQKPLVVFLQDNSASIGKALGAQNASFAENRKTLLRQLSKDFRVLTWNLNGPIASDSLNRYDATTTNVSEPIEDLVSQFYQQNLSALILASDGQINEGANPAYSNLPLNTFVYTIAIGDTGKRPDLRVQKVYANKTVSLNSDWELLADVVGNDLAAAEVQVVLTDESGHTLADTRIRSQNGTVSKQLSFSLKANQEGLHQYTITAIPLASEVNTVNNRNRVTVQVVAEKKKILLVYNSPNPDVKAISAALQSHKQYELELSENFPDNPDAYAAVILHQLPAAGKPVPAAWTRSKNVWYIAGAPSNYAELNKMQQTVRFMPGGLNTGAQVVINKAFGLFNVSADLPAVTEQLPPLQAAGDAAVNGPGQVLFADANGRPLWVITTGTPATAVTTGDGIWRWRFYEFKNFGKQSSIDECIVQTLNLLSNTDRNRRFRVTSSKNNWNNGEQVQLSAWFRNAAGADINTPEVLFQLKDSSGKTSKFSFERSGSHYRLNIGALAAGTYTYSASTSAEGKTFTDQGRFFVNESSPEFTETGCNYPLLAALAHKNHGAILLTNQLNALYDSIKKNAAIKPLLTEREEPVDLISRKWLFFLMLLLATVEWVLRKYWMAM